MDDTANSMIVYIPLSMGSSVGSSYARPRCHSTCHSQHTAMNVLYQGQHPMDAQFIQLKLFYLSKLDFPHCRRRVCCIWVSGVKYFSFQMYEPSLSTMLSGSEYKRIYPSYDAHSSLRQLHKFYRNEQTSPYCISNLVCEIPGVKYRT